jgi:hypothetical protein
MADTSHLGTTHRGLLRPERGESCALRKTERPLSLKCVGKIMNSTKAVFYKKKI